MEARTVQTVRQSFPPTYYLARYKLAAHRFAGDRHEREALTTVAGALMATSIE